MPRNEKKLPRNRRRKSCPFSEAKATHIDYKDVITLKKFINPETGKLIPARVTGVKPRYQRMLTEAIKRARYMALLPMAPR
jgi:small subunit ribosomal protein S18